MTYHFTGYSNHVESLLHWCFIYWKIVTNITILTATVNVIIIGFIAEDYYLLKNLMILQGLFNFTTYPKIFRLNLDYHYSVRFH